MKKIIIEKLLLLFVLLFALVACVGTNDTAVKTNHVDAYGNTLDYFIVDGMPCIEASERMSCDWSLWDGRVEDGNIILPAGVIVYEE